MIMAPLSFCITFLLYSSLLFISCLAAKTEAIGSRYHSVDVTSLLAASACTRQVSTDSTTLEVVDIRGPCSPHIKNKPSLADILSHDQSRVDNTLPAAYPGVPLRYYNYVVTVGLGTPPQNVTLAFDTGSSLSWTQCQPCFSHCYKQRGPVYNPLSSCTYSSISCYSSQCSKLSYDKYCYAGPCIYSSVYEDGSYSVGAVSKDRLTVRQTTNDVFPDFIFGCGQKNRGLLGAEVSGILGLNRNSNRSFVYQTKRKYGLCFSYCLPSTGSSTGLLAFGGNKCNNSANNVRFTPLIPDPYSYRVEIVGISVGGARLPIKPSVFQNPGTIIDSGMVITRLPQDAYVAMRDAFKKSVRYPTAPAYSLFDTCYNVTNLSTIMFPTVSFTFSGGVDVEIDSNGAVYSVDSTLMCFAFAGNSDHSIFGSHQQKTIEMVYDVAGERLGFRPHGCK